MGTSQLIILDLTIFPVEELVTILLRVVVTQSYYGVVQNQTRKLMNRRACQRFSLLRFSCSPLTKWLVF